MDMTAKFCEQCGNAIREGARFCGACGARIVAESAATAGSSVGAPVNTRAAAPPSISNVRVRDWFRTIQNEGLGDRVELDDVRALAAKLRELRDSHRLPEDVFRKLHSV